MLVRSPSLTIAFRPHVVFRSCTVEHINMLHLNPIFHHMSCKVSGCMVYLEAEWLTVDSDQLLSEKLADMDLHCIQNRALPSRMIRD